MATPTSKLGLTKPAVGEAYDINILNENFNKIDAAGISGWTPVTYLNGCSGTVYVKKIDLIDTVYIRGSCNMSGGADFPTSAIDAFTIPIGFRNPLYSRIAIPRYVGGVAGGLMAYINTSGIVQIGAVGPSFSTAYFMHSWMTV
jgi:hypothetical protein